MPGATTHELYVSEMQNNTFLCAMTFASFLTLPSHALEHIDTEREKGGRQEQYTLDMDRSEFDGHYSNDRWLDPPAEYANKSSSVWTDTNAIARGEKIWVKHCVACHGEDGQGTGLMAESLSHLPADMSNNFHVAPGTGDAYLFWRLSEGGAIEPFKSLGSRMPPFKDVLSESERWDVLAYVHAFFHQGLIHWTLPAQTTGKEERNLDQD